MNQRLPTVLATLALAAAIVVAVISYVFVPQFIEIYSGFKFELPWYSQVLVSSYKWLLLFPLLVVLAWVAWPNVAKRRSVAAAIGLLGAPLLFCLGMWAAYRPIWMAGLER